jgi:REP element-mobilizing transposase RayT
VSTVTKDRVAYFKEPILCELFIKQVKLGKLTRNFKLYGFVIIPDHVHMIIHPAEGDTISKVMHFLKRHMSRDANIMMGFTDGPNNAPSVGRDRDPCLRMHGGVRRIGIDIDMYRTRFKHIYSDYNPIPKFAWQVSFWDRIIRSDRELGYQLKYLW